MENPVFRIVPSWCSIHGSTFYQEQVPESGDCSSGYGTCPICFPELDRILLDPNRVWCCQLHGLVIRDSMGDINPCSKCQEAGKFLNSYVSVCNVHGVTPRSKDGGCRICENQERVHTTIENTDLNRYCARCGSVIEDLPEGPGMDDHMRAVFCHRCAGYQAIYEGDLLSRKVATLEANYEALLKQVREHVARSVDMTLDRFGERIEKFSSEIHSLIESMKPNAKTP